MTVKHSFKEAKMVANDDCSVRFFYDYSVFDWTQKNVHFFTLLQNIVLLNATKPFHTL